MPRKTSVSTDIIREYRRLQERLAERVVEEPLGAEPQTIGAVDVHLAGDRGIAAAVVLGWPELKVVEERTAQLAVTFPYIPGLLSFREAPVCLAALRSLTSLPDLLLVDGQGRAHPRRFGIACHLGVELDIPTVGIAKSVLVGRHPPLGEERGRRAPLIADEEVVGEAVRTRTGVSPVYVSVGNRITLDEAVYWTLATTRGYRLPEPSRLAHRLAKRLAADLRAP